MHSALEAYLDAHELPGELVRQLRGATEIVGAEQFDFLTDQLAVRLTLTWQQLCPLVLCHVPDGLVLMGMLMRRLAFPLSIGVLPQAPGAQERELSAVSGRPVILVSGGAVVGSGLSESVSSLTQAGAIQIAVVGVLPGPGVDDAVVGVELSQTIAGVPVGCGFDIAGYGANLPELYSV